MLLNIDPIDIEQKQNLLRQHRRNLSYLERQAAQYGLDAPLAIHNALIAEQDAAATLERELATLGVSPQPKPKWQALVIDTDSHWRQIIINNISQLGGLAIEHHAVPGPEHESIETSAVAIVGVPNYTGEQSTRQWLEDVVKLGHRLPLILLACFENRDTAIALRQTIDDGPKKIMVVTVFRENFDPNWFSRVVHKILIY